MYHGGGSSCGDKFYGSGERIDSYPAIPESLTHICVQELPENELVAIVSATKECTSESVKDRVMETNSKAAVRED